MKRNLICFIIVGLLATAWGAYWYWHHTQMQPQDKHEALQITCIHNLKQIGLAFKLWEGDHDDQFPFNLSTNAGGTREWCRRDQAGFDTNAYLHFRAMTNELSTPRILICPQDRAKKSAADFGGLLPANITYRLRTGTNVTDTNSRAILAVCPVDGNILYVDGSVKEAK